MTVMHTAVRRPDVVLPAKNTKTFRCLMAVRHSFPRDINTGDVAEVARLEKKETASLLVTLMVRGLVERVSERRGLAGGSEWRLTPVSRGLLQTE